jgi:hypothetical protein
MPMMAGMDWLTAIPLIVGAIGKLSACALQALAARLLTVVLTVFFVAGLSLFAVTAFAWLWLKRLVGELHALPSAARH